jgi:hypothetical protein
LPEGQPDDYIGTYQLTDQITGFADRRGLAATHRRRPGDRSAPPCGVADRV